MLLSDFEIIRPRFETDQSDTLDWLIEAHVQSEKDESFRSAIRERLWHVGCKPEHIQKRGHVLADFLHLDWNRMEIYRLHELPEGVDLSKRASLFQTEVHQVFERYYPETAIAPDDLIHVSCTGYASPSGAQKIVSQRHWNATTVTHAYHMGCYGSIPAIRMGSGFLNSDEGKSRTDVVHTEICSLHSNPSKHELDQLVSQSLFADGFIKYSILKSCKKPHLQVLAVREEIIPNSTHAMTWDVMGWGFQMSLSKEVPVFITRHLEAYLNRLCKNKIPPEAIFAIHPGGPKILQYVQKVLNLSDEQMSFSFEILKNYGNMSSATLPHIWERILGDLKVAAGTPIISLAFGPGLTIAGAWMEKRLE